MNTFGYFSNNKIITKAFASTLADVSRNFSYENCTFGIAEDKEKTLRSMADSLGVKNCITIESSYYGRSQSSTVHSYTSSDLHEIGEAILKTMQKFMREDCIEEQIQLFSKAEKSRQLMRSQTAQNCANCSSERSDSDPEGDYLDVVERMEIQTLQ